MSNETLSGEILRRVAAGDLDFQGISVPGANLAGASLRGANLRGANLRGANLHGADLRQANLIRTDLGMADVGMTDFGGADLNGADFRGANLKGANFSGATMDGANLRGADLHAADLCGAKLVRADLSRADLHVANLSLSDLRGADLRGADLASVNLKDASLHGATLHGADLRGADLTGADLHGANLTDTRIDSANLTNATVGATVFADLDLRGAKGLETLHHGSPSTVGTDTLSRSLGNIPEMFLRGCGLTPREILAARVYDPSLTPAQAEALQQQARSARVEGRMPRKRVLISHSRSDAPFVEELRRLFLGRGVFSWEAPHETKGALRERHSKLAIQHDLALLLVLSEHSVQSDWVEHEMRLARKLEKSLGERVLSPVSLDDAGETWAAQGRALGRLDEDVLSFANWQNQAFMEQQFATLVAGMALFHPPPGAS